MPILSISHVTTYRYRQPVSFGEHRIMVRPREGHDQRLLEADLHIAPEPTELRRRHDVFGNSVALVRFDGRARALRVASRVRLEHLPVAPEDVEVEPYARRHPFGYSPEDMPDLLRSIERAHPDPEHAVDAWARRFGRPGAETLPMLAAMTAAIRREFTYVPRPEAGTQAPTETLAKRQGTCRDYAVLMMDAARALGLAARFVSGYVYSPSRGEGRVGGGATHAWVRIFLPGSGWTDFDPTNAIVGNAGLVRVAEARDPRHVLPLSGTWFGFPGSDEAMEVEVEVTMEPAAPASSPPPDAPPPAAALRRLETTPC